MTRFSRVLLVGVVLWQGIGTGQAADDGPESAPRREAAEASFRGDVLPMLRRRCFACHGDGESLEGRLDLRSRAAMLKGGESGEPALVPAKPDESPLYRAVLRTGDIVMPPKERNRLTADETTALRRWIAAGAPWPERTADNPAPAEWNAADGIAMPTSGGLSADWTHRRYPPEDVWAFFPVREVAVPPVTADESAVTNPIDAFLAEGLREKNLLPAPPADRRTWIRRASFDLTGLPPTPDEVAAFLADQSPDATTRVIDRLLASPHYGERMAQHWLDVVRYADTGGFSNDYERPHAWRYRDYVIRSFNEDAPYNRFVVEQIAGDELAPDDPELRIAVGYLRMGPWEHTGMSVAAETRQMFLDDVTHGVGVTFLGLGLNCCKCHDHKFDPLPTRDYYRVQAVFAATQFAEPDTSFLPDEHTAELAALAARVRQQRDDKHWFTTDDAENDSARRITKKRKEYLERASRRYRPQSLSVKTADPEPTHILLGGALETPGDAVGPGVLSAVRFEMDNSSAFAMPQSSGGRRLALARWIVDPGNPLTARVIVNRVWQMHFGTGLVATSNNFGKMGARPTHPDLLDWLARRFVEDGWSIKELHRRIMSSSAYHRASTHSDMETVRRIDPKNERLAYFPPRRLTAEELRDAMLAVTGELSRTMGGPGVFPEINWEVALQPRHIMGSVAPAYQPSPTPEERHRRTVYAFRHRTLADPLLEVFNRPGSDASCERRDETTVTPQVFALFNGQDVHHRALALAHRLGERSDDPAGQIDHAFRLVYGRVPTAEQRRTCLDHVARLTAHHRRHEPVKVEYPTWVARAMIDEQTGRPFTWREKLHNLLDYQPDLQPWMAAPHTRALAEVCLVLFNSNEFVYVY